MKALIPFLLCVLLLAAISTSRAQTASDYNEGLCVTTTAVADEYEFSWWGKSGHSYFLQISTDLVNWTYVPDFIEGGNASAMVWGMTTTSPRHFFRLRFTNQTAANLDTADFDNDGLQNLQEITPSNQGGSATDPLDADCDDDTWLDGIEHDSGSLPHDAASTPMTVALARFNELQSALAAYESLRQSGSGTYAQLASMHSALLADWDALQSLLDDIDDAAPSAPTAPMRPGAQAGPGGAPPLAAAPPAEPPQPHSTGDLVGRWITSSYSELREGFIYGDWSWQETLDENGLPNGGAWMPVVGTANYSWEEATRLDGPWEQSSGASGENQTLEQAMNRDQTQEPGDFQPGAAFSSANGSYTDEAQTPPSHSLLPEPNTPGQSPGEVQTTYNRPLYAGLTFNSQISELRLRRSAEGSRQTLIVRGFLVEMTDTDTQSGQSTRSYRSETLDIQPGAEESGGSLALNGKTTTANTSRNETAQGYEIKPHGSMYNTDGTGKLGDLVPSVVPNSKVKHFVTPKKTDEIPDEHVVLVAEGLTAADFQEGPNNAPAKFSWSGGEAGDTDNERKVSRANHDRVSVKITDQAGGHVEMIVWVVWAEGSVTQVGNTGFTRPPDFPTIDGTPSSQAVWGVDTTHPWKFKFTIQPGTIITNGERPDLEGVNKSSPPGRKNIITGLPAGNGVNKKWDVSRWINLTIKNAGMIPRTKFCSDWGNLYDAQAKALDEPLKKPAKDTEGNDDSNNTDEDNNPYSVAGGLVAHGIGEIASYDHPSYWTPDVGGAENDEIEHKALFNEFARLEINKKWYRISDDLKWRLIQRVKKTGNLFQNNGSDVGLGH